MKRKISYELSLLLAIALGGASAMPTMGQEFPSGAGTNVLTLDGAIRLALAVNPELSAAGSQISGAAGRAYRLSCGRIPSWN
jgi:hypothetical protein